MRTAEDILRPPDDADVARALERFAETVEAEYGGEVVGLFLFGSRARGDHAPFSDADVAVVLDRQTLRLVPEKRRMARIAHDVLVETGVEVQPWPVILAHWTAPERHPNSGLIRNMLRDAKRVVRP